MSLKAQRGTLKEDQAQSITCSSEIATDKVPNKQQVHGLEGEGHTLDSDETFPNIELDTVIDRNNLNKSSQDIGGGTDINEDINEDHFSGEEGDGDFGSFDEADDGDFGNFDEANDDFDRFAPDYQAEKTPTFNRLQEALDLWQKLLNQIYDNYKPVESFTGNAPKSIRTYVLEEAPESLHSRLTWDSVTRYMDNDTGIPKVRWYQSEIEKLHLNALACKRSAVPISYTGPTMLDTTTTAIDIRSLHSMDSEPMYKDETIKTSLSSATAISTPEFEDIAINTRSSSSTPTSEQRSSVFGFSSLSRYLPHLSKTNLPKSPTSPIPPTSAASIPSSDSPISSPLTPSRSSLRNYDVSISTAINHTNTNHSLASNNLAMGKIRRSNTMSFSSIRAKASDNSILNILDDDFDPKPRPISFHANQQPRSTGMELFDLTDDGHAVRSPTSSQFNSISFKPLVPTISPISPINRRNTLPASTRSVAIEPVFNMKERLDTVKSAIEPAITMNASLDMMEEDDFGDFTGQQDGFTKMACNDDPFDTLSYTQPSPRHDTKNSSHPQYSTLSSMILTPTRVMSPTTTDILSPKATESSAFDIFSPIEKTSNVRMDIDLFDISADNSTNAVTDQNKTVENKMDDDDDWGDWAF